MSHHGGRTGRKLMSSPREQISRRNQQQRALWGGLLWHACVHDVVKRGEKNKQTKEHTRICTLLFGWPPSSSRLNGSLPRGDSESLQPNALKNSFARCILLLKPLWNNTVWGYYQSVFEIIFHLGLSWVDVLHWIWIDYTGLFALYFTQLHHMFGYMLNLICCILFICIKSNCITSPLALHCIISQCKHFVS